MFLETQTKLHWIVRCKIANGEIETEAILNLTLWVIADDMTTFFKEENREDEKYRSHYKENT